MTAYSNKNSFKIKLDNFQSVTDAELEFIQGINLICGESNSGKSAILRAIRNTVLNPKKPQKYINYKANDLCVDVNYLENSIQWKVTPKGAKYVVNGEDYIKVGGVNLPKLLEKSGFVITSDNKLMNVEGELELPFPFGLNSSELFKLFEKGIVCTSDSALINKAMKEDEANNKSQKEQVAYEQERLANKLKAVKQLENEVDLNKLNTYRSSFKELIFRINKMKEDFKGAEEGVEAAKKLRTFKQPPEINSDIAINYEALYNAFSKLSLLRAKCEVLSVNKFDKEIADIDFFNLVNLKQDYKKLLHIYKALKLLKTLQIETLSLPDVEGKLSKLQSDYNNLLNIKKQLLELRGKRQAQTELVNDLKEKLEEFNVCPLCGQEIKHE